MPRIVTAVALLSLAVVGAETTAQPALQGRLLNPLDGPALPGVGGWMMNDLAVRPAEGVEPRVGATALAVRGRASRAGAKVDATLFKGDLPGCRRLSLWVSTDEAANVESVGLQVQDAEGEWLMQTVPADWAGWKRIDVDPTAGGMRPAYEQKDRDGKVNLPLRSVHLVWFAKAAGTTSLRVDGLTAGVEVEGAGGGVTVHADGDKVLEPGKPLLLHFIAENRDASEKCAAVRWTLQANPTYADPVSPDPTLGYDHARGAASTVVVDGVDKGDAKVSDGDEHSAFEIPWGSGFKESVVTIELGEARNVSAVRWLAGDANWVFKADVSTSRDGVSFEPVEGTQGFDLHGKWGGPHAFPWPKPVAARYLRLRFHKDGEAVNAVRLPPTIMVYDGVGNDAVAVPQVGPVVASGADEAAVPARDFAEVVIRGEAKVGPGAYLLGQEWTIDGRKEARWGHVFVLPADAVPPDAARRFGINGASTEHAQSMRRCGFGWVRFENAKWQMYMPRRDHAAFDGTVAPWHIHYDRMFGDYQAGGLRVLPYVFQPPEWASGAPAEVKQNRSNYPPKDAADYGDAIFQLVARFGRAKVDASRLKTTDKKTGLGLIDAVELWNEPNLNDPTWGPFVGTMAQYFEVMRAGAEGARRADPSLPVTSGGLAGIDLGIVGQLSEYRYADGKTPLDLVDVVNVHFYSGRDEPETAGSDPNVNRSGAKVDGATYPEQLEDLVEWRDRLKPGAEIWMTETGNDVGGPIGRSERHQAAKVPRSVILALAAGVDRVFIYRETGSSPAMHAGAGLLRDDNTMRPVWLTVATMIRQLQGIEGRALRLPSTDPNVWMFLWQQGDRRLMIAWTLGEPRKLGIDFGAADVCDGFGRSASVPGTADVLLGYVPTYFNITAQTPALAEMTAVARARAEQRAAERRRQADMPVRLFDFGSAEHVGMLKGFGPPRRFTPVGKDALWDEKAGYGFATPATSNEDARWVPDPLERDGCRVAPGNVFRFGLEAGTYVLRVRASAFNDAHSTEVLIRSGEVLQRKLVSREAPVAEFTVGGGAHAVEVSLKEDGVLRWISAVPEVGTTR